MADVALDQFHSPNLVLDLERHVSPWHSCALVQPCFFSSFVINSAIYSRPGIESGERNSVPPQIHSDTNTVFEINNTLEAHQ